MEKTIYVSMSKPEPKKTPKPKVEARKRIVTLNKKWTFDNIDDNLQQKTLASLGITEESKFILQQIANKIHSYRSQDIEKKLYDETAFVDISCVLQKMHESKLLCFYCQNPTMIVYEYARDPKQWTLERIDNAYGHNKNNVEIACLSCNIRRRTMYHERFRFTKQLTISKLDSNVAGEESETDSTNLDNIA